MGCLNQGFPMGTFVPLGSRLQRLRVGIIQDKLKMIPVSLAQKCTRDRFYFYILLIMLKKDCVYLCQNLRQYYRLCRTQAQLLLASETIIIKPCELKEKNPPDSETWLSIEVDITSGAFTLHQARLVLWKKKKVLNCWNGNERPWWHWRAASSIIQTHQHLRSSDLAKVPWNRLRGPCLCVNCLGFLLIVFPDLFSQNLTQNFIIKK